MEHLKYERDHWIYRPSEEGPTVEIEVSYTLGGANFFHGGSNPRGIYASIRPVTLEKHPGGSILRSYTLLGSLRQSGGRMHVLDLPRRNQRQLDRIAYILDSAAPVIARLWLEGRLDEAYHLLRQTLSPVTSKAA